MNTYDIIGHFLQNATMRTLEHDAGTVNCKNEKTKFSLLRMKLSEKSLHEGIFHFRHFSV